MCCSSWDTQQNLRVLQKWGWNLYLAEVVKDKTIVDIWNEVKKEEEIETEAFEFLAAQVDIDNFHQKIRGIKDIKMNNKK